MLALVLSGGGMFGAWQAGAWSVLARHMTPDLIVGCSVGSLNGYTLAAGATPEQLVDLWRDPGRASFRNLHGNLQELTSHPLRHPFALTVTDLLRMKPRTFRDGEVTWRHLAASCAVPFVQPQMKIDGRWYSDGGLLNALPVWAAVELGATRIVGLHLLPEFPVPWMQPAVNAFRLMFGHTPPVPQGVRVGTVAPAARLGSLRDALEWKEENIERWLEQGARDASLAMERKSFPL